MKYKDEIEREYERAISAASNRGDSDEAYYLSIGLKQYRQMYKHSVPAFSSVG